MDPLSRRSFIKGAGAAAAAAGVAAAVPLGAAGATARSAAREPALGADEEPLTGEHLMAHLTNARTGEISVFLGEREITFHDRQVAARLRRAIA